jgi:hypothetical protein
MTPKDAVRQITVALEEFLKHGKTWDDLMSDIDYCVDSVAVSCYGVGYTDGLNKKPDNPMRT